MKMFALHWGGLSDLRTDEQINKCARIPRRCIRGTGRAKEKCVTVLMVLRRVAGARWWQMNKEKKKKKHTLRARHRPAATKPIHQRRPLAANEDPATSWTYCEHLVCLSLSFPLSTSLSVCLSPTVRARVLTCVGHTDTRAASECASELHATCNLSLSLLQTPLTSQRANPQPANSSELSNPIHCTNRRQTTLLQSALSQCLSQSILTYRPIAAKTSLSSHNNEMSTVARNKTPTVPLQQPIKCL